MLVNDMDIGIYKAILLSKDIQTAEVTVYDDWLRNALNPLYMGKQETYKQIKIQLLIKDTSEENALTDISNLVKQFEKCTIKFDDLDYYYDCLIVSKSQEKIVTDIYTVDVELKSNYAYKSPVISNFTGKTDIVTVDGNTETPAIVSVTMPIDTISVTLMGLSEDPITIKNLHKDVPVNVDSEVGIITENGNNKFGDCDLWQFPFLQPGTNTITTDNDNAKVQISYKPRWI